MVNSNSFVKATGSFVCNSFAALLLLLSIALNCFSQPKPKQKAAVAKAPVQINFVMCEVMPGTEVASKAPFTIPFKNAAAWPTEDSKAGCRYIFKSDNEEAGLSIALTDLGSIKNALASYKNAWQASKDLWDEAPASAIVLRDTGFFSGKDECGLKWHLGKYILDINFKGQFPDVSDQQKKESGIVLAAIVMARLKYLLKQ